MLLGHWVKLEWLELMEMQTRATRIGFLETLAFPVVPVALAACHLPDEGYGPWCAQNTTSISNLSSLLVYMPLSLFHAHHPPFFTNRHDHYH